MVSGIRHAIHALLLLLVCAPLAHGQSRTYNGSVLNSDAALHAPLLSGRISPLSHPIEPAPILEIRRSRTAYFVAGGAVIGAAVGIAVLFAPRDCRTAEAMCGIAIPFYAGAGALGGGLIGYLVRSSSR